MVGDHENILHKFHTQVALAPRYHSVEGNKSFQRVKSMGLVAWTSWVMRGEVAYCGLPFSSVKPGFWLGCQPIGLWHRCEDDTHGQLPQRVQVDGKWQGSSEPRAAAAESGKWRLHSQDPRHL